VLESRHAPLCSHANLASFLAGPLSVRTECNLRLTHGGKKQHWTSEAPDIEWRGQPTSGRKEEGILSLMNFLLPSHKLCSKHTLLLIDSFRVPNCFQLLEISPSASRSAVCRTQDDYFRSHVIETGDVKYIKVTGWKNQYDCNSMFVFLSESSSTEAGLP
jgi:hypothetical protein